MNLGKMRMGAFAFCSLVSGISMIDASYEAIHHKIDKRMVLIMSQKSSRVRSSGRYILSSSASRASSHTPKGSVPG